MSGIPIPSTEKIVSQLRLKPAMPLIVSALLSLLLVLFVVTWPIYWLTDFLRIWDVKTVCITERRLLIVAMGGFLQRPKIMRAYDLTNTYLSIEKNQHEVVLVARTAKESVMYRLYGTPHHIQQIRESGLSFFFAQRGYRFSL